MPDRGGMSAALPLGNRYTDQAEGEIREDQTPWQVRLAEKIESALGLPQPHDPQFAMKALTGLVGMAAGLDYGAQGLNLLHDITSATSALRVGEQGAMTLTERAGLGQARNLVPIEMLANESPQQAWLRTLHNQRLARQNITGLQYGMPPVAMQGPNAELAPSWSALYPSLRGNSGKAADVTEWTKLGKVPADTPRALPYVPRRMPVVDPPVDPAEWKALMERAAGPLYREK